MSSGRPCPFQFSTLLPPGAVVDHPIVAAMILALIGAAPHGPAARPAFVQLARGAGASPRPKARRCRTVGEGITENSIFPFSQYPCDNCVPPLSRGRESPCRKFRCSIEIPYVSACSTQPRPRVTMQKWAVLTALLPLNRAKSQFSMYPPFSVIPSPTVQKRC